MMPRTFTLAAAFFLAACSSSTDKSSTFEDSSSSPSDPGSVITTESPTEPAEDAPVSKKVPDTCTFGTKTAAGCEVTYAIDVSAASATLPKTCNAGLTAYNDCTGEPIELGWKDIGDRPPKSARLEVGVSIFCADPRLDASSPQRQGVAVNGDTIGGFDGDVSACSCGAHATSHAFDVTAEALAAYKHGGDNRLSVTGPNRCIGFGGLDGTHTVARIVVTY